MVIKSVKVGDTISKKEIWPKAMGGTKYVAVKVLKKRNDLVLVNNYNLKTKQWLYHVGRINKNSVLINAIKFTDKSEAIKKYGELTLKCSINKINSIKVGDKLANGGTVAFKRGKLVILKRDNQNKYDVGLIDQGGCFTYKLTFDSKAKAESYFKSQEKYHRND